MLALFIDESKCKFSFKSSIQLHRGQRDSGYFYNSIIYTTIKKVIFHETFFVCRLSGLIFSFLNILKASKFQFCFHVLMRGGWIKWEDTEMNFPWTIKMINFFHNSTQYFLSHAFESTKNDFHQVLVGKCSGEFTFLLFLVHHFCYISTIIPL